MAQQFIISGSIFLSEADRPLHEGKAQAFDRDLPSLERRGLAPQLLGESSIDDEGRFSIPYTDERFRTAEGERDALAVRRRSKTAADLSFRIVGSMGRELPIVRLVTSEREFRPEEIIFNAPPEVVQSLNPNMSADQAFSFRTQFADQWCDLHNSEQTKTPMAVRFQTVREDFPPNLENLKIQHILLYFAPANEQSLELPITQLRFTAHSEQGTVGGSATPIGGIISTRRGSAASWTTLIGKAPIGTWQLELPNTQEVRDFFKHEHIDDILLVITYSGRTPTWPT